MEGLLQPTHFFIIMIGLFIGIGLSILIAAFLYTDFQRIPPTFRKLDPGLVWLLLIPCLTSYGTSLFFRSFPSLSRLTSTPSVTPQWAIAGMTWRLATPSARLSPSSRSWDVLQDWCPWFW